MWRAFAVAIGIFLCILGAECLVIDKAVLAGPTEPQTTAATGFFQPAPPAPKRREIKPPECAPWILLSSGAVVIIYSFTLPRRNG